jgi:hypothetical protein
LSNGNIYIMEIKEIIDGVRTILEAAVAKSNTVVGTADSGDYRRLLDSALTQSGVNYWEGAVLTITGGTNAGQSRVVRKFNPDTDTIEVTSRFSYPIDSTSVYNLTFLPMSSAKVYEWPVLSVGEQDAIIIVEPTDQGAEMGATIGDTVGSRIEIMPLKISCGMKLQSTVTQTGVEKVIHIDSFYDFIEQIKAVLRNNRALDVQTKKLRILSTSQGFGTLPNQADVHRLISTILISYERDV